MMRVFFLRSGVEQLNCRHKFLYYAGVEVVIDSDKLKKGKT